MFRMLVVVGGGVAGIPSPVPAREGESPSVYDTTKHTGYQAVYGLLPQSGRVHWVPNGGL